MKKYFLILLAYFATLSSAFCEDVPKYLELAREIVQKVKPENNIYTNDNRVFALPGDFLTKDIVVRTDCSGFVEEVLYRGSGKWFHFSVEKQKNRVSASDFVYGIEHSQDGIKEVKNIDELVPGDIMAWSYKASRHTGHIVLIDSKPFNRVQIDENTFRSDIWIIDMSDSPSSPDDERNKREYKGGVGKGRLYLFASVDGQLKGMSKTFKKSKIVNQNSDRHIVFGRP